MHAREVFLRWDDVADLFEVDEWVHYSERASDVSWYEAMGWLDRWYEEWSRYRDDESKELPDAVYAQLQEMSYEVVGDAVAHWVFEQEVAFVVDYLKSLADQCSVERGSVTARRRGHLGDSGRLRYMFTEDPVTSVRYDESRGLFLVTVTRALGVLSSEESGSTYDEYSFFVQGWWATRRADLLRVLCNGADACTPADSYKRWARDLDWSGPSPHRELASKTAKILADAGIE